MARAQRQPKRHSLVWLQGLACGALAALVPSLALMVGILLGPGLVTLVLDQEPTKPVARAVLLCGVAAIVDPIRQLWSAGHGLEASLALAGDLRVVGAAWSAAAAGWLLAELAPVVVRVALEAGGRARAVQLRAARARLAEQWGLPAGEG